MGYRKSVDKEATLKEVMNEVTLTDLGGQLKYILASSGCFAVAGAISAVVGVGVESTVPDFNIPNYVWVAGFTALFVVIFTEYSSYHEIKIAFWFPKLSWTSLIITTAAVVGLFQSIAFAGTLPPGLPRLIISAIIFVFILSPLIVFLSLANLGYVRLMEKRKAALKQPEDAGGLFESD